MNDTTKTAATPGAAAAPAAIPTDAQWDSMSYADKRAPALAAEPMAAKPTTSDGQQTGQQQHQQQAQRRPNYIPEKFVDATTGKVDEDKFGEYVNGLVAKEAAEQSRKALIPNPQAYKAELPKDFKLPVGLNFEFDNNDPIMTQFRALAHKRGLDQDAFSEGLGMIAAMKVGDAQNFKAAFDAEVTKLGATASDRVTAVTTWLGAMGGKDADALCKVLTMCPRADTITAFENLMRKVSSQGGGGYSGMHRDAPEAGPTDAQWEAMSFAQRREYSTQANRPTKR